MNPDNVKAALVWGLFAAKGVAGQVIELVLPSNNSANGTVPDSHSTKEDETSNWLLFGLGSAAAVMLAGTLLAKRYGWCDEEKNASQATASTVSSYGSINKPSGGEQEVDSEDEEAGFGLI